MIKKTKKDEFLSLLEDSSNLSGGYADIAVLPQGPLEISDFIQDANAKGLSLTVSGAGTGVTGARIPFGGAIISCELLNKIVDIRNDDKRAILEPAVTWDNLRQELDKMDLWFGPDPTEARASIGGAVSTNASGARSFKYGSVRNYVNRLKVILADGSQLEIKRGQILSTREGIFDFRMPSGENLKFKIPSYSMPAIKNAAGYFIKRPMDLIDLFIGQEGTLGVIAEVELSLLDKPEIIGFFIFFDKEEGLLDFIEEVKGFSRKSFETGFLHPDIEASSIEYFDENALNILRTIHPNIPNRYAALFIEQEIKGVDKGVIIDKWIRLLESYKVSIDDVWFADNKKDEESFKDIRHSLPEKVNEIIRQNKKPKVGTDIAVPDAGFRDMLRFYTDILKKSSIPFLVFGHIADNHLHVNILPRSDEELEQARQIYMKFVKKAVSLGGTVSAEHGIGKLKHKFLEEMYGPGGIREMASLKKVFDQKGILGQGNIFPKELLQ